MAGKITLQDVFHSSGDGRRYIQYENDYGHFLDWFKNGWISYRRIEIGEIEAVKNVFDRLQKALSENRLDFLYPRFTEYYVDLCGGIDHTWLGYYAAAYLTSIGKSYHCEVTTSGKRVDFISRDDEWIIECGDTDASPVLYHLYQTCKSFAVLPFCGRDNLPRLFVFERGENWDQAIAKIEKPGKAALRRQAGRLRY